MIKQFLEIGEITGTHGVRGEVRVNPWCDSPDFIKKFKTLYFDSEGRESVKISSRPHGNIALVKIEGIDTVEEARKLRGRILWMKRSDAHLPEGRYFIAELIGCRVFDADNLEKCYGELTDVSETGANDVWHITKDGREYLIPSIPDVVIETDVASDRIIIRPLKGIFDDED
ncbi:MAG: 16S rRNA processing protein RimM [Clostridia bacterium]|nr:16S rRNA processing protein RimM [Clostridia bacterium]